MINLSRNADPHKTTNVVIRDFEYLSGYYDCKEGKISNSLKDSKDYIDGWSRRYEEEQMEATRTEAH